MSSIKDPAGGVPSGIQSTPHGSPQYLQSFMLPSFMYSGACAIIVAPVKQSPYDSP